GRSDVRDAKHRPARQADSTGPCAWRGLPFDRPGPDTRPAAPRGAWLRGFAVRAGASSGRRAGGVSNPRFALPHPATIGAIVEATMHRTDNVYEFAGGEVRFWIEQEGSIHLKAITSRGDPTELRATETRPIAAALMEAANKLDALD